MSDKNISALSKKLRIKPEHRIAIINAPPEFPEAIGPLPAGAMVSQQIVSQDLEGSFDLILYFARNSQNLDEAVPALSMVLKPEGLFWIAFPKRSSGVETDLSRDEGWEAVNKAGMRTVALISIDTTWSAARIRPSANESAEEIITSQYKGRKADLKPIYDRVLEEVGKLGDDVEIASRKTYIAFVRKRQFGVIMPSTNTRVDLGLKLKDQLPEGRLADAGNFGSGSITHKISLFAVNDVDGEVAGWLRMAYEGVA
jgi:predicted transport protein